MTSFTLTAPDGIPLSGIANHPDEPKRGLLCFHMMPATKESYEPLMKALELKNILVYAIDFRGHGESTNNGSLDYQKFTDTDHQNYILDARASYEEMKKRIEPRVVIGASIGANIALQLQVEFAIPKSILLSPGLDYYGVKTISNAGRLSPNQSCFIITSHETRPSGKKIEEESQTILQAIPGLNKKITITTGNEHGTNILDSNQVIFDEVIGFITT